MKYKPVSTICSRCPNDRRPSGRLCSACHAADMKKWRSDRIYVRKDKVAAR